MSGGIYLLRGEDELLEMTEQPYDSEEILQALIAKFPSLLAGDQYGTDAPRRWLLIGREAALPDEEDGGGRWSVDHLFLDQDAVPTLVEVKRSSDTPHPAGSDRADAGLCGKRRRLLADRPAPRVPHRPGRPHRPGSGGACRGRGWRGS